MVASSSTQPTGRQMKTVAIHQPNYLPWLGYFYKISQSDIFVFLDDVQYSKNSFTNRVKILRDGEARRLTQPVSFNFGDPIAAVTIARDDWKTAHLDSLKGAYKSAPEFNTVWPDIEAIFNALEDTDLATANMNVISGMCRHLGIVTEFHQSSSIDGHALSSDDRLIHLVNKLAPGGCYLSGKGGSGYQDPKKFSDAGISLRYTEFSPIDYPQSSQSFIPGLSTIDAVFHLGWQKAAQLLKF